MLRLLSVIASTLLLSACALKPQTVKEIEYVSKPKLVIQDPEKPVISNRNWKVEGERVYIQRKEFESLLVDLINIQVYIQSLQTNVDSYRSYYEAE